MAAGPLTWFLMYQLGLPLRNTSLALSTVFFVAIAYPVLEEIVFRGAIQTSLLEHSTLRRSFAGISLACIIASVLFAAAHLLRQPAAWAALVFLPSLVFGWARERHKTLFSPILLHMSYNAGFIGIFKTGVA